MRLLLDTHTLLWWLDDEKRMLSEKAYKALANKRNTVFVSAASIWEICIKRSRRKLDAPNDLEKGIEYSRFHPLPIVFSHALMIETLPHHHNDPFDRILLAQAKSEDLTLVSRDTQMGLYGVPILKA